ncbi:MAG: amidohydrolase family protein [Desulfobacterales bacterium]|nr:amidohydrolase family protein [Desulfobacterales bacterium]
MIIDSHVHLFYENSDPMSWFIGSARSGVAVLNKATGEKMDPYELYEQTAPQLFDKNGDKLVGWMDEAGIDRAIVLPIDLRLLTDAPSATDIDFPTIEEKNHTYFEATRRHKGRLFACAGMDPRRKNAAGLFKKGLEEWGMIGLKLHPTAGYYPHEPACYALYEVARQYNVPVIIHSGNEPAPLKCMYSQPKYIDAAAADFPEVTFIVAHCGHGWYEEVVDLATMKPNIYCDFCGWQVEYLTHPDYFFRALRYAMDFLGPWRVLFGTDGPAYTLLMSNKDWVEAIRNPASPSGIKFSKEEIDIFLGGAAARLYGWE